MTNWGRIIGFVMSGLCVLCSAGYGAAHDWRKAIYWLLAAGINFVIVY